MTNIFLLLASLFISTSLLASEKSLYNFNWLDKDKEIYVLQNRKFRKDGKAYIGVTGNYTMSGAFINAYGGTVRGGFFFSEDWGVELLYGKSIGSENDTAKGVREQGTVPYYRKVDNYMGGMLMWSPFYSKINTFNRIFYFDWMFGVGAATISTLDNRNRFVAGLDNSKLTSDSSVGALWNTGFRFHLTESWSIRTDVTGLHFSADKTKQVEGSRPTTTSMLFSNFDVGIGLNYTF